MKGKSLVLDEPPELVVVTGGGGPGIGSAVVRAIAATGRPVAVADASRDEAVRICTSVGRADVRPYVVDVRSAASVQQLVRDCTRDLGAIGGLVNNAGRGLLAPLLETSEDDWDDVAAVDLRGSFLMARACLASMVSTGGAMVHIASVQALSPSPGYAAYAAAKAGLCSLSRSIAREHGRDGVRSNVIHPGLVDTPANRRLIADREDPETYMADFTRRHQMLPRAVSADDVAEAAVFLLSPRAAAITGVEVAVDAGFSQLHEPPDRS